MVLKTFKVAFVTNDFVSAKSAVWKNFKIKKTMYKYRIVIGVCINSSLFQFFSSNAMKKLSSFRDYNAFPRPALVFTNINITNEDEDFTHWTLKQRLFKNREQCEAMTGAINSHSCFIIINIAAAAASAAAAAAVTPSGIAVMQPVRI